jgi:diguanylate cyclase (GGDEF)-like protein
MPLERAAPASPQLRITVTMSQANFLQTLPDIFLLVGADGVVQEHLGGGSNDPVLDAAAMPGRALAQLWPSDVAEQMQRAIRRVLSTRNGERLELRLERGDAQAAYEARLFVQGRRQVLLILRDVSGEKDRDAGMRRAALYDTATGLPGRELFLEHLSQSLAEARLRERGLAVVFLSLDSVSRVADALGRGVADLLVREVAQLLTRSLRESDRVTLIGEGEHTERVAALGGDTFGLVLANVRLREEARAVARRLRNVLRDPVQVQSHRLTVQVSIGVCLSPGDGGDVETLLKHASAALSEARLAGRGDAEFYSDSLRQRPLNRLDMENELRFAMENGQLELHYQPRCDAQSLEPVGIEALLRWPHPVRGSVALEELIPLAEATGLELPISEWVLRTVCAQVQAWRRSGLVLPRVAVNLSHQQFSLEDLPERISSALAAFGLPGSALELDLTERMLMRASESARMVERCKELGVSIMLDDFGTGYSSLGRLSKLAVDGLKIDRSFVGKLESDASSRSACAGIIALAKQLRLACVAEGVESESQLAWLRGQGCDQIQGFLYCRPLDASALAVWMRARQAPNARLA